MKSDKINRNSKSKKRIETILVAARSILVEKGYAGFTFRNVAKEAGTTVGSIQHFFESKNGLLHALLDFTVQDFFVGFERIAHNERLSGTEKLRAYIESIFEAFPSEQKTKFFPEFWALSNHNDNAAEFLRRMYETGLKPLVHIISEINPRLSRREHEEIALAVVGCIEGLIVFIGYKRPWQKYAPAIQEHVMEACIYIASSIQPKT